MKLIGLITTAIALIGNLFQGNKSLKDEVTAAHDRESALADKLDAAQRSLAEAGHESADAVQEQLTAARSELDTAKGKLAQYDTDSAALAQAGDTLAAAINEATEVPVNVNPGFVPVTTAPEGAPAEPAPAPVGGEGEGAGESTGTGTGEGTGEGSEGSKTE